jgi:hypothetical protein
MARRKRTPEDVWNYIDTSAGEDGCWLWTGSRSQKGYGYFYIDGGYKIAHRYVYERLIGPIPEAYTLDHVCHNEDKTCLVGDECQHRRCVNPAHLCPETMAQNRKNAARKRPHTKHDGTGSRPARASCPKGHPYNEENTGWVERRGTRERYCKACNREKVYRAKYGSERPADWDVSLSRAGVSVCHRGHAYDEQNTRYDSTTGKRRCRSCERINDRASKERRKTSS